MRSAPSQCAVACALVLAGLWLAAAGRPLALSDAGPHVHYGWGEPIRLRHLYTAGPHGLSSCFLRIRADGAVDCARGQSAHSECPSGPPPVPEPLLPFTSFGSRGSPLTGTPGLGTAAFHSLPGPLDSARSRGGGTGPCTDRTHVLWAPRVLAAAFCFPSSQVWWRSEQSLCAPWPSRACTASGTSAWAPTAGCKGW